MTFIEKAKLLANKIQILASAVDIDTGEIVIYLSNLGRAVTKSFVFSAVLSLFSLFTDWAEVFVFADRAFIHILFTLFICDIFSGIVKHIKLRNFSFTELALKFLVKIIVSTIFMVSFNALAQIKGLPVEGKHYFELLGKIMNGIYVGGSVFWNIHIITNGVFPPIGWMERTKEFNKTLNLKKFITPNKDENRNKSDTE